MYYNIKARPEKPVSKVAFQFESASTFLSIDEREQFLPRRLLAK